MIDIHIEFKGQGMVVRALEGVRDDLTRKSLIGDIARGAVVSIKARTLDGYDEKDRALVRSKRAERDGGQTLSDKGSMLASMRVLSSSPTKATIGFGAARENLKAWWAQDGTKPHPLTPRGKPPLAWKPGGGRAKGGAWAFSRGHMHPGTPKRPFFGISPKNESALQAWAERYVARAIAKAGLA